jgi:hypothetical protein
MEATRSSGIFEKHEEDYLAYIAYIASYHKTD